MVTEPEVTDQQLIEQVKSGQLKSFEALVIRHQGMVFRFLFHFMGNQADAEDITQETFITVHRKLHQHNPAQSFKSWMMTIARNLAISFHRKRSPTPLDPSKLADAVKGCSPAPEEYLLLKEAGTEVHEALSELPDISREVLIMHYLLDLPLQSVSELLNIPEGTVKSRLFKARKQIRAKLTKTTNVRDLEVG